MSDQYGAPDLAARIADEPVPDGAVALLWLGQASVAIKARAEDDAYTTVYREAGDFAVEYGKYVYTG